MRELITAYNPLLALCAIVLIPVIIWWERQYASSKTKLLGYFLILFFSQGSISLLQLINDTILRYLLEIPVILLFLTTLHKGYKRSSLPGHRLLVIFILISTISAMQTTITMDILFCLYYIEIFLAFLYFRNGLSQTGREQVNKLFMYLCIAQIFASFIKFNLVGILEPYIGTMSSHEGGITTLFAMSAFGFCLMFYFAKRENKYILLAIGFILFGIIGEKRALAFFFPIIYFISIIIHSFITKSWFQNSKLILGGIFIAPVLFYTVCRLSPTLNPDQKVGGRFDIEYVLDYTDQYNHAEIGEDEDVGRSEAVTVFQHKLFKDNPFHILFGYGSGTLIPSSFNEVGNIIDFSLEKFGIGYSMGIGYLKLLAQVGILGTITYYLIFIIILFQLCRRTATVQEYLTEDELAFCNGAIILILVVLIVTISYNSTGFYLNCSSLAIMWFVSYALSILDNVDKELEENDASTT